MADDRNRRDFVPCRCHERSFRIRILGDRILVPSIHVAQVGRPSAHGIVDRQSIYVFESIEKRYAEDVEGCLAKWHGPIRLGWSNWRAAGHLASQSPSGRKIDVGLRRISYFVCGLFVAQACECKVESYRRRSQRNNCGIHWRHGRRVYRVPRCRGCGVDWFERSSQAGDKIDRAAIHPGIADHLAGGNCLCLLVDLWKPLLGIVGYHFTHRFARYDQWRLALQAHIRPELQESLFHLVGNLRSRSPC